MPGRNDIVDNTSSQTAPGEGALTPQGKKDGRVHSIPGRRQTVEQEEETEATEERRTQRPKLLEYSLIILKVTRNISDSL